MIDQIKSYKISNKTKYIDNQLLKDEIFTTEGIK